LAPTVAFDGMSMHMAPVGDGFRVHYFRDLYTVALELDTNPTFFCIPQIMKSF
jgi:hypothetical protein